MDCDVRRSEYYYKYDHIICFSPWRALARLGLDREKERVQNFAITALTTGSSPGRWGKIRSAPDAHRGEMGDAQQACKQRGDRIYDGHYGCTLVLPSPFFFCRCT